MMQTKTIQAQEYFGPLTGPQIQSIIEHYKSPHQFDLHSDYVAVFVASDFILHLDRAAMVSVGSALHWEAAMSPLTTRVVALAWRLKERPAPDPKPEPRWRARVRFKTLGGVDEQIHLLEEVDELQEIVERGPNWGDLKNVKIKLEYIG